MASLIKVEPYTYATFLNHVIKKFRGQKTNDHEHTGCWEEKFFEAIKSSHDSGRPISNEDYNAAITSWVASPKYSPTMPLTGPIRGCDNANEIRDAVKAIHELVSPPNQNPVPPGVHQRRSQAQLRKFKKARVRQQRQLTSTAASAMAYGEAQFPFEYMNTKLEDALPEIEENEGEDEGEDEDRDEMGDEGNDDWAPVSFNLPLR